MPRRVSFEGRQYSFPDDATDEEIAGVLEQPRETAPQRQAGVADEVRGAIASFNEGIPFADEISGVGRGVFEGAREAMSGGNFGQGYQRGYRQQTGEDRAALADYRQRRPLTSNFLTGTGMAAPAVATMGAATPQSLTGGVGGLVRRSAEAATIGAGAGFLYGAGAEEGPLEDRLMAGNEGAAWGAGLGVVAPPALAVAGQGARLARPAWEAVVGAGRRIPTPDPNSVGAMGRPMRPSSPTPRPAPRMDAATGTAIERLANRSRQTPAQIESRLAQGRANPEGRVLADVFDTPGVQTLRSLSQGPGQTAQRATERARTRFQAAPDRILGELNRRLRVAETPEQALASLERDYRRASAEAYNPLWERPTTDRQRAFYEINVAPLLDDPIMQDAVSRADRIFERERRLGLVRGNADDHLGRYLHMIKMSLDDSISQAMRRSDGSGAGATELRSIMELRNRYLSALDNGDQSTAIIPGYAEARARWGGLEEARTALEDGATLINQSAEAIRTRMGELTPFAQYHARVGFANAIAQRIGLRGSVNGNRNVAEALGSPEMQRRVAAMFDDPADAAAFLDTLNTQNMLMRNAGQWNGGSSTAANLAYQEDNLLGALEQGATGRRGTAARGVLNAARAPFVEQSNNRVGEALLRSVDDDAEFARQVVEELRRREAARASQSRTSRAAGAAGGASQRRE